jgi:hypothetical protein
LGGGGAGMRCGQNPSCDRERWRTAQSVASDAGESMRMSHKVWTRNQASDAGE